MSILSSSATLGPFTAVGPFTTIRRFVAIPQSVEIQKQLTAVHLANYAEEVFTLKWWVLLALIVLAVIFWWRLIDKSRLSEVLLYASIALVCMMGIEEYGEELALWTYPVDIIPIFPTLTSANLLLMPLMYSLLFQRYRMIGLFLATSFVGTAVICFALEPLLARLELYEMIRWRYYWDFLQFFLSAIFSRAVALKVKRITAAKIAKVEGTQ